jgi:hypothetical protein
MSSLNICGRRNRRVEGGVTPWLHLSPHHHPLLHISQLIPGQIFKTTSLFILLLLYLCCLCCTWTVSWACAALMHVRLQELCAAHRRVCLQGPVLHLHVSVYKSFVMQLDVSVYKSLCCTCACLSTCKSFVLHCCTWTCLPTGAQPMLYL